MNIRLRNAFIVLTLLFFFGGLIFKLLEPITWIDAYYLAAMTISTVGYGDIVPMREITRIFMIFYMFIGVGAALYTVSVFAEDRLHKKIKAGGFLHHTEPEKPSRRKNGRKKKK